MDILASLTFYFLQVKTDAYCFATQKVIMLIVSYNVNLSVYITMMKRH